jgi:prepilin-type N-terminal cleavage/methylation domain-containing protein
MKRYILDGFSLIEVVIATAIVVAVLGALYAVASMTTRLTVQGQDRTIASQLAREGIEVAKQIRDSNAVVPASVCKSQSRCLDWWNGLNQPGKSGVLVSIQKSSQTGFAFQSPGQSEQNCHGELVARPLDKGKEQLFCRRIFIEPVNEATLNEQAVRIRSQVAWLGYGRNRFRDVSAASIGAENPCPAPRTATEWCTEQITLLTSWRPVP